MVKIIADARIEYGDVEQQQHHLVVPSGMDAEECPPPPLPRLFATG